MRVDSGEELRFEAIAICTGRRLTSFIDKNNLRSQMTGLFRRADEGMEA